MIKNTWKNSIEQRPKVSQDITKLEQQLWKGLALGDKDNTKVKLR